MRVTSLALGPSFLAFLLGVLFYGAQPKQSIVLFNQEALQGQFIRQLAEHHATAMQVEQATQHFHQSIKKILAQYSKDHQAVILNQKYVFEGGNDITEEVALKLSGLMRSKT
ncbi:MULTISPECIES: TrbI F-type domain-containing protein [Legionella]|uniref:F pilus extension/retraction protein TrbI Inner membrane protein n=1 Tax=Legionella cincinnatiensis TaxID=28085 RepID=A0A378IJ79_9GAMM|nr:MULTISPECIES: TrbI F-type domain-containing protein [Legionella]VEE04211.1 F pilus extension/retraction protein TrbI Inner membrane protein [Legionella oakridgensis]ARB92960.1 type-F conjugative transfer system protein TrbI [Legionella longbeachae]KTC78719.1 F pilus extension/retraction protein TrbI Inner membrane protein [Legionella cincinnatiensis]RZV26612.1 type-F conjugative transfer system protein TrbI [Legionella longbeachae]UAK47147.1 type-F conjugative transfer system protein TrbI [